MTIEYSERFSYKYSHLQASIRSKVDKALKLLDENFRHPGLQSHPVQSLPGVYEAYVDDKYRITYDRKGNIFTMRNVDNHDECLRNP
jgi:mRNA-degrading endonuclease YafQ of YafQ-DinJ toxin-antitoxin module